MTDEEMAEAARDFLTALQVFITACEAYDADQLDPCDPIRELMRDAEYAVDYTQAELDGAERRIRQARIETARRNRTPKSKVKVIA